MTESTSETDTGYDPEEIFNEGHALGYADADEQLRDELADTLEDQGFDQDEIEEALYDPSPRRHRRGRRRSRRYSGMRYADPAPRRRGRKGRRRGSGRGRGKTYTRYGRRAKGTLGKFAKYALPGAALITFAGGYVARARALGTNPDTNRPYTVFEALEKDIREFDGNAAMTRLQNNMGNIATPLIAGWAVKKTNIFGKYSKIAGDLLMGIGIGTTGKKLLDPPISGRISNGNVRSRSTPCNGGARPCLNNERVTREAATATATAAAPMPIIPVQRQEIPAAANSDGYVAWGF